MLTRKRFRRLALVGVVGVGAVLLLRPLWPAAGRTIPTGAGFTVAVTQLPSLPQARTIASRIAAAGIPAFTRRNDRAYQVVAGPYVSLDEADSAQRFFAKRGFKARVVVDESVRRQAGHDGPSLVTAAANVVLIAGAGSLAVVIELPEEPRHIATQTLTANHLEIVAGPVASRVKPAHWNAPAGVALLRSVAIDEAVEGNTRSLRARVTTPRLVEATVRTAGRRIYIDLANPAPWPEPEELAIGKALTASRERIVQDYRLTIAPLMDRLETIEPFVMSAVARPAGDVLAALERSLRALAAWADEVTPPGQWRQSHEVIVAAVTKAAESVSASFTGDRAVKAREAFALKDEAKRSLDPPADQPGATQ
jgi:sporulation related protein